MRKTIHIIAFILLIWVVLDSLDMPDKFVYFLLIGALPGTAASLSPTLMLAIMTGLIGLILFEFTARRFEVMRRIRHFLFGTISRRERLPSRRFTRI